MPDYNFENNPSKYVKVGRTTYASADVARQQGVSVGNSSSSSGGGGSSSISSQPTGFTQVKLGGSTYGGYNPTTNQAIAFSNPEEFGKYFKSFDPNAPQASFDTLGIRAAPNRVLDVKQISPQPNVDVPNPTTSSPDTTGSGAVAEAKTGVKSTQDYIDEETAPETALDRRLQSLLDERTDLTQEAGGRGAAQLASEEKQNVPVITKQLSDLNAQILSESAGYDQLLADLEAGAGAKGLTTGILLGQQGAVARQKASSIGLLQARALGLQGQLNAAQRIADRAVDLQYADADDKLRLNQAQIEALQPLLNKQEKIQANALLRKNADDQYKLDQERAKVKENLNIVITAGISAPLVNRNGEWFNSKTGKPYASPAEVFKDFPQLRGSLANAYSQGLVIDFGNDKIADLNFTMEARAKYPTAGILPTDSPEVVASKISKTAQYKKENYIAPSGGSGGITDAAGNPVKLSAAQQSTLADWENVSSFANQALTLGGVDFAGTGGLYKGSIMQFLAKNFGQGSKEEQDLRNIIGNITGTLAKARGGTSFTANEQALLETYTPTINDSPVVLKSKLNSLIGFVNIAKDNIYKSAGAVTNYAQSITSQNLITKPDGSVWQQNADGSYTQIK